MHIIKLNTIGSTNTFLKEMAFKGLIENYTVVTAENQFEGRGQMGSKWESEKGKNLTFSVFVRFGEFEIAGNNYLSYATSLALFRVLLTYKLPKLKIKWPNDILSDGKKIGGILIENNFKKKYLNYSVIGIGINVNQECYSSELKEATSLKNILGKEVDKDNLLASFLKSIKKEIDRCVPENFQEIKREYLDHLYKKETPTMFKDSKGVVFMGKIVGVSSSGSLQVTLENELIKEYDVKEIQFLKN